MAAAAQGARRLAVRPAGDATLVAGAAARDVGDVGGTRRVRHRRDRRAEDRGRRRVSARCIWVSDQMASAANACAIELAAVGPRETGHAEASAVDAQATAVAVTRAPRRLAMHASPAVVAHARARLLVALAVLMAVGGARACLACEAAEARVARTLPVGARGEALRCRAALRAPRKIARGAREVGGALANAMVAHAVARAIVRADFKGAIGALVAIMARARAVDAEACHTRCAMTVRGQASCEARPENFSAHRCDGSRSDTGSSPRSQFPSSRDGTRMRPRRTCPCRCS